MSYIADLHIHSRFSLATSKALTVPHLAFWAARKGINVLGTGDFTHPAWRAELARDLILDEQSGFYRCRQDLQAQYSPGLPVRDPLFCLQAEISCIYKRDGKVRKIHNLVYAPDLAAAGEISRKLALVGNLGSDGRPILGLDSHDLLEIVLESSPRAVLVPAHIWTPWFALFGSRSGFDSLEECYGDLSRHIFALETGLSSDPAMNRCVSALDKYALISNSDAHSGANLGREANLFSGSPSYDGMFEALRMSAAGMERDGNEFLGTLEFYPQEGKYHLDGHRACNVVLTPEESRKLGDICPVCGKKLTIGVLHRVMELADRPLPADSSVPFGPQPTMLTPLPEVLSQIIGSGTGSRKVQDRYEKVIENLGPELAVLCTLPVEQIRAYWPLLGEAVDRLRSGHVNVCSGYDGEYGRVLIFDESEQCGPGLVPEKSPTRKRPAHEALQAPPGVSRNHEQKEDTGRPQEFSSSQQSALTGDAGPRFIAAGPGSGKTRCLVGRIRHLVRNGVDPKRILTVTFTRRAAEELRQRLKASRLDPRIDTLHGLAFSLHSECGANDDRQTGDQLRHCPSLLSEESAKAIFGQANPELSPAQVRESWDRLNLCLETQTELPPALAGIHDKYRALKSMTGTLDFTDLLVWLKEHASDFAGRWTHILVDEAQDLSVLQISCIKALLPAGGNGLFAIGDPDQAIYSFRGSVADILVSLRAVWPNLTIQSLADSYRSLQPILDLGRDILGSDVLCPPLRSQKSGACSLRLFHARNEYGEARWISRNIKKLLGATAHTLADMDAGDEALAPADIAVLVRLKAQIPPIIKALEQAGLPFDAPARQEFWHEDGFREFLDLARADNLSPADMAAKLSLAPDPAALHSFVSGPGFARLAHLWDECKDWEILLQKLAWLEEAEMISRKSNRIQILTMHASKGLEFEYVFLPGLEDGLLPLRREKIFSDTDPEQADLHGEQRLLYVAVTRAARGVYASYCDGRRLYGREHHFQPSPWLPALEKFCACIREVRRVRREPASLSLFDMM